MADEIYEADIYTLTDEDGNESQFELISTCELDGNKYFALVPYSVEGEDDSGEYIVLRGDTDENGEELLVTIEDDEEFDRVADYFDDEFADIDYDADGSDE